VLLACAVESAKKQVWSLGDGGVWGSLVFFHFSSLDARKAWPAWPRRGLASSGQPQASKLMKKASL